jgi:hypothetical protein
MNKIISSLIEYLDSKSACYELDDARQVLHLGMEAENARWRCLACQDDSGRFVFVSLLPLNAPPARWAACAELFARINAKLGLGHFDIDFKDGELGYRTAVPVPKRGRLPRELAEHVLHGHQVIVDRFIPAISAVLFAGFDPRKALAPTLEPPPPTNSQPRFMFPFR